MELIADWFDVNAPSDDLIVIGDGDPGFKLPLDTEQYKKFLASQEKKNGT